MKPPAVFRSPVFWLGLFVLMFLVWAWSDSWTTWTRSSGQLTLKNGAATVGLPPDGASMYGGKIVLSWTSATALQPGVSTYRTRYEIWRDPARLNGERFAMPVVVSEPNEIPSWGTVIRRRAEIPLWLIVTIYLVPWGGVLLWRQWRVRRLARLSGVIGDQ